ALAVRDRPVGWMSLFTSTGIRRMDRARSPYGTVASGNSPLAGRRVGFFQELGDLVLENHALILQTLQTQVVHGFAAVFHFINTFIQRLVVLCQLNELRTGAVQLLELLAEFRKFARQGMVF